MTASQPTPATEPRILVVDDEAHIREVVQYALQQQGFVVDIAADGEQALAALAGDGVARYDLVVLDILMPELDGLTVCKRLRETSEVPIIFLSSRGEEVDRVMGLELGGDDYIVKPFSPRELVSRIRTVLRRADPGARRERAVTHGPLVVDPVRHQVTAAGTVVPVTATELAILHAILLERGRTLSREQLIERVYQQRTFVSPRTMDTHVRRLRAKLRPLGLHPIETVHGVGYRSASPPSVRD